MHLFMHWALFMQDGQQQLPRNEVEDYESRLQACVGGSYSVFVYVLDDMETLRRVLLFKGTLAPA